MRLHAPARYCIAAGAGARPSALRPHAATLTAVAVLLSTPNKFNFAHQVICIDNFFTGSKENIAHLIGKPNFEVIRHDVVEPILLEVDQVGGLGTPVCF